MKNLSGGLALWTVLVSAPCAQAETSLTCDQFNHAKSLYELGDRKGAIAELKALEKKCPKSADIRRLLSDIYWWEGQSRASTQEANSGFALLSPELGDFEDTKLHFADRLHPLQIRAHFAELSADQSTGQDYSIEGDARISGKEHVLFGVYRTSRIYAGNVAVSDTRIEAGHVLAFAKNGYWENNLEYSPSASIYARYGMATTPHWVTTKDVDLFLSARYNHYQTSGPNAAEIVSFTPGFIRNFGERITFTLEEIATHSFHWLNSTQAGINYLPSNRLNAGVSFSTGHIIEGPGLEGDFRDFNFNLKIRITPTLALIPNEEIYRGSVRDETSTGITFEARF